MIREMLYSRVGWPWREVPDFPREAYLLPGDEPLICPWNLTYRTAHMAVELSSMLPGTLGERLFPPEFISSASDVVTSDVHIDRHDTPSDSHERISIWTVPIRWLSAMRGTDKKYSTSHRTRHLLYRAPIRDVRARLHIAMSIANEHDWIDEDLAGAIDSTLTWLRGFDDASKVELDFGGLTTLWTDRQLAEDDSVDLTWKALEEANDGNTSGAEKHLERLNARFREIRAKERLN